MYLNKRKTFQIDGVYTSNCINDERGSEVDWLVFYLGQRTIFKYIDVY